MFRDHKQSSCASGKKPKSLSFPLLRLDCLSMRGGGGKVKKGKGDQIFGERKKFNFEW